MIDGVELTDLKIITDDRGSVRHMLKVSDPHFRAFGEIYFSTINAGVVKAWHLHRKMWLNYACIAGQIVVGLMDTRYTSPTYEEREMHILDSRESYKLLTIPPGVWNGFRIPMGSPYSEATVANCATLPHDPGEIIRKHPDEFPDFDWGEYEVAG
ncbi:MAG: hypothetical protein K940chlam2_00019 [Chlamydiae bacterium]|nr:hypothetical protein [Chlamydiota bacterium]